MNKFIRYYENEIKLIGIFLVSIFIVNPLGDFPLNDDWSYADSVWKLYQENTLTINFWPAMTLVVQIVWGTIFCKLFGLSYLSLRISTLVSSLVGIILIYRFGMLLTKRKDISFILALTLLFNPLYFSLSYTFMTDVHFLTCTLFAAYYFYRYIQHPVTKYLILGSIFSVVATMIRQPGIVFPFALTTTLLITAPRVKEKLLGCIPMILCLIALKIHSYWLQSIQYTGNIVGFKEAINLVQIVNEPYPILVRFRYFFLYSGLFSLPIGLLYWKEIYEHILLNKWSSIIFIVSVVLILIGGNIHFPGGNILYNCGIGPKLQRDATGCINVHPAIPHNLWLEGMKTAGTIGAVLMFWILFKLKKFSIHFSQTIDNQTKWFFYLFILVYSGLLLINATFFDRYLIPFFAVFPLLMIATTVPQHNTKWNGSLMVLLIFILFSIGGTHDYLSWNRAKWKATDYLVQDLKIDPNKIDGGFEFNGTLVLKKSKLAPYSPVHSWWWVTDDTYMITFGPMKGYHTIKTFPYEQYLSTQTDSIFVLKRD